MNDTTTATTRTTVNGTILTALIIAAANVFGWSIEMADLAPFLPVLAAVILGFYRLSLTLSERWPWVGYVLFGTKKTPTYPPPAPGTQQ